MPDDDLSEGPKHVALLIEGIKTCCVRRRYIYWNQNVTM
jgi:hypothetical protein